jgi:hypothetical protein
MCRIVAFPAANGANAIDHKVATYLRAPLKEAFHNLYTGAGRHDNSYSRKVLEFLHCKAKALRLGYRTPEVFDSGFDGVDSDWSDVLQVSSKSCLRARLCGRISFW